LPGTRCNRDARVPPYKRKEGTALPQKSWRTARPKGRNDGTATPSLGIWNNAPWRTGRCAAHNPDAMLRGCARNILLRYDLSRLNPFLAVAVLRSSLGAEYVDAIDPQGDGRAPLPRHLATNDTQRRWESPRTISRGCDNRCVVANATRVLFMVMNKNGGYGELTAQSGLKAMSACRSWLARADQTPTEYPYKSFRSKRLLPR
jgi:hypothetical protein